MPKIGRINAVREIIMAAPERIDRLLILEDSGNPKVRELEALARERRIPVQAVPRKQLDRDLPRHQGLLAHVSPKGFVSVEAILEGKDNPFLVLLDGVEDPQNLGAIIRSAEGAGVHGVVLPARRAAGLTPAVYEVSAGAAEHLPVAQVTNLARTMELLKRSGLWLVGAEGGGGRPWYDFDYTAPIALVLGSEGRGLRPLVKSKCDAILSLPLSGAVSSLNVSAAAAIFLYEVVRQRSGNGSKSIKM
jgi:23S rRNA (guanosine2251-2'-O)-methyltransferase